MKYIEEDVMVSAIILAGENWETNINGEVPFINDEIRAYESKLVKFKKVIVDGNTFSKDSELNVERNHYENVEQLLRDNFKSGEEIVLFGGVAKEFLRYCTKIILIKIYKTYPDANEYFPNLDKDRSWYISDVSVLKIDKNIMYRFVTYKRDKK